MSATAIGTSGSRAGQAAQRLRSRVLPLDWALTRYLDAVLAAGMFVAGFLVYHATLAPGLTYVSLDGNELTTVPQRLGLLHSPGYPFYTWLGRLFGFLPVGDVAYRANLMSACGAAGAAALVFGIVTLLTRSRLAAVFAALVFAFSPTLWSQAVITEVYAPNIFMLALTLFLALAWGERVGRRPLSAGDRSTSFLFAAACLSFGLSLGTHMSNVAVAPALLVYLLLVARGAAIPRRTYVAGFGLFLLAACQFLWLPLRASTLNDDLMLRHAPYDWQGVYDYMFRVFHNIMFAFPISALPQRLGVYAGLVGDNFGWWGAALALIGAWDMFHRRRKAFWLLALAYAAELAFFTQYNVPDIDVFFIPAHLLLVIFIAFGVRRLLEQAARLPLRRWRLPARGGLAVLLLLPVGLQLHGSWAANDHAGDTTIGDFYSHVFSVLPQNSLLATRPGVPGYDLFYYRLIKGWRPDVAIPQARSPYAPSADEMQGRPLFTTAVPDGRGAKLWAGDVNPFPQDLWYVPVLAAPSVFESWLGGHQHTLYEGRSEPPRLVVTSADPQYAVNKEMNGVELVGLDLDRTAVEAGGTIHLTLYWRPLKAPALTHYRVSTILGEDDRYRETHTLGFGLLQRYQRDHMLQTGDIVVEDYDLVVMSGLAPGEHLLRLATSDYGPLGAKTVATVDLAKVTVLRPQ